jgi:hypothetical protein
VEEKIALFSEGVLYFLTIILTKFPRLRFRVKCYREIEGPSINHKLELVTIAAQTALAFIEHSPKYRLRWIAEDVSILTPYPDSKLLGRYERLAVE